MDDAPADYVEEVDSEVGGPRTRPRPSQSPSSPIAPARTSSAPQAIVNLPTGTASPAELSSTGLVVCPNTQTDADTVAVRTGTNAIEIFHLLRSASAPRSFTYRPALRPGGEITVGTDNTMMISNPQGDVTTFVTAPLALDAKGNSIPVSMTLSGNGIVVSLAPASGQAVSYPVLLDPGYGYGSITSAERNYCFWNPYDCSVA